MKRKILIRSARHKDVFDVAELCEKGRQESLTEMPPLPIPHVYIWYHQLVEAQMVFVAESSGAITGILMMGQEFWPWDVHRVEPIGTVPVFYVDPEFRSGGTAIRLLRKAEERAAELGMTVFMPEMNNGVKPEAKARMMSGEGYVTAGAVFWKRLRS